MWQDDVCINERCKTALMLTQLKEGERARIVAIEGGHGLRQKLFLRGLFEGSIVRVVSCQGPITVEVDRNTVSIGRGMAQKIMVIRVR
jgi:ferrous iron transport protein A